MTELARSPFSAADEPQVAFTASRPFALFDYFRVPYRLAGTAEGGGLAELVPGGGRGPRLLWCPTGEQPRRRVTAGRFELAGMQLAGRVVSDAAVRDALAGAPGWRPAEPLHDAHGRRLASVWRHVLDGSVALPFDPGEVMLTLWSEAYLDPGRLPVRTVARRTALRGYYLLRPVLPRALQLRLRRAFTRVQEQAVFPRWPAEDGLHELYEWLFTQLADLAGPFPWLAPWPDGCDWALVLTHDVETAAGLAQRELLREPERERGLRSSWNLVAERYEIDDRDVRALRDEGCEIGVHGLRHDGRDLGSRRRLRARLPAMRRAARRFGAEGFRAPATQRRWTFMPELGFAYDTSSPDTDPYEPQPGGCCTVLPFFNRDLVELPITMPQDHTLFAILGHLDATTWLDKAGYVRDRGGMALVLTHPDYATDDRVTAAYRTLLSTVHDDPAVWHALPREVAQWWRQRASSTIRWADGCWEIDGPAAARGRVRVGGVPGAAAVRSWPAPRRPAQSEHG